MRAIDADACESYFWEHLDDNGMAAAMNAINDMPTIEPEIIRCKDCKHQVKEWRDDKRLKDKGYWVCGCDVVGDACGYWALLGQYDDYCSYAERKEQNVENS
jgi:hypothetical protein